MVAQYLANVAFGSTIPSMRRKFCEGEIPIIASLVVPLVTPVNEVQNETTSHDGSFDHVRSNRELVGEWKMRHVCSLSRISGKQVASENHIHPPNVCYGAKSPQWCGGPAA